MNLAEKLNEDFVQVANRGYGAVKPPLLSICQSRIDVEDNEKKEYLKLVSKTRPIPVWRFFDEGDAIESKKPVTVKIGKGDELYFAENDALCIFASGATPEEALEDFEKQTVHFYFYYKSLPMKKLTGQAQALKGIYKNNFSEIKA